MADSCLLCMIYNFGTFSDDVKKMPSCQRTGEALRKGVSDVQAALDELMGHLTLSILSQDSFIHCTHTARGIFSTVLYSLDVSVVDEADVIMKKLRNSFETAAADDKSAPLMDNAQKVYAGMTYGKGRLTESVYKR